MAREDDGAGGLEEGELPEAAEADQQPLGSAVAEKETVPAYRFLHDWGQGAGCVAYDAASSVVRLARWHDIVVT